MPDDLAAWTRDWVLQDAEVNVAVGAEVRAAREASGLTRPELVAQLPFKTTVATLLNWELGKRSISYARLVEACRTLNRTAPDLLRRAIDRVDSIHAMTVELDIEQLSADTNPEFGTLRTWAVHKLASRVDAGPIVQVHHTVIREWAVLLAVPLVDLVHHLEKAASLQRVSAYEKLV